MNTISSVTSGLTAAPNAFPFQVLLEYNNTIQNATYCRGIILNTIFILTAAHCVNSKDFKFLTVIAGKHDGQYFNKDTEQRRNVSRFRIHHNYKKAINQHDIALLVMSEPLEFNENVNKILYSNMKTEFFGTAVAIGWGNTLSNSYTEQKVTGPIMPIPHCQKIWGVNATRYWDDKICVGQMNKGKPKCDDDFGKALLCSDKNNTNELLLCGIISSGNQCGNFGVQFMYTKVSKYSSWIQKTIRKFGSTLATTPLRLKNSVPSKPRMFYKTRKPTTTTKRLPSMSTARISTTISIPSTKLTTSMPMPSKPISTTTVMSSTTSIPPTKSKLSSGSDKIAIISWIFYILVISTLINCVQPFLLEDFFF